MQKTLIIIAAALLCGCTKPTPPSLPRWKYEAFEWNNERFDRELHPNKTLATKVRFTTGRMISQYVDQWDETTAVNIDDLLNEIGKYGWELVCFDGKRYIVKRSDDWDWPKHYGGTFHTYPIFPK